MYKIFARLASLGTLFLHVLFGLFVTQNINVLINLRYTGSDEGLFDPCTIVLMAVKSKNLFLTGAVESGTFSPWPRYALTRPTDKQ